MNKSSIYHINEHNFAYAVSENQLNIRIRTAKNDIDKIVIYYKNVYDHSEFYFKKQMDIILEDDNCSLYETTIKVEERHFKYYFELFFDGNKVFYTADGFLDKVHENNCFYFPVINDDDIISLPKWAEGATIYQILIDRFFDGNSLNNPPNTRPPDALPDNNTYYGGDFEGIIQKIDYIKSLGADILYLSPIFVSPTYHKYDTKDYYAVEEIYGGVEHLKKMIDIAKKNQIKVMLDGVFNHCSVENELFQDVIKNGEKSKYKDWFIIDSFPIDTEKGNYDSFGGLVPSMPRFNTANKEVIEYFCKVCLYWTKELGIDGWRLDVADEVSHTFWQQFRRQIKEYNSDILIVGEAWNHASKWLQGNEFDTVTNYKFRKWMLDFAKGDINASSFWNKISANSMLYKTPLNNYLINLLGSHDTIRYASYLGDKQISLLAMVLTLTMPGIPLIYYGDEYAQEGGEDPDNRRAMQWHRTINNDFVTTVKKVANLRKNSSVLRMGGVKPLYLNNELALGFIRSYKGEQVIVITNFGEEDILFENNNYKIIMAMGEVEKNKYLVIKPKEFVILGKNNAR